MRAKILVDTREKDDKKHQIIYQHLMEMEDKDVEISVKSGGTADYIIIDAVGNQWGIERKSFLDCFGSIIEEEKDGGHRIYGQLTELIRDYGSRAIFLLEYPTYFPVRFDPRSNKFDKKVHITPETIKQAVFTFFSERSLVMPCMMTKDKKHTAFLLIKLAKKIHTMEFRGRGYKVVREGSEKNGG